MLRLRIAISSGPCCQEVGRKDLWSTDREQACDYDIASTQSPHHFTSPIRATQLLRSSATSTDHLESIPTSRDKQSTQCQVRSAHPTRGTGLILVHPRIDIESNRDPHRDTRATTPPPQAPLPAQACSFLHLRLPVHRVQERQQATAAAERLHTLQRKPARCVADAQTSITEAREGC